MTPIALTMGEPAGVCGEITQAAWLRLRRAGGPAFFVIADLDWARDAAEAAGGACTPITHPREAVDCFTDALPVLPISLAAPVRLGQPDDRNAPAAVRSIDLAVRCVQDGVASALVTNPIHKLTLYRGADFAYPGHTEYLAALAGVPRTVMLMASDVLKVAPVTVHIPLAEAPSALSADALRETIEILQASLRRDFGVDHPRIAVAGLNPHAGEGGAIGAEEIDLIIPVLTALRREGLDLLGPLSADTMFHAEARRSYDAAVCMYHDQALIPIKTLAFDDGVNTTLGLPFVRTSPDHGPALDIAARGGARPDSLVAAIHLAARMAARRAAL